MKFNDALEMIDSGYSPRFIVKFEEKDGE